MEPDTKRLCTPGAIPASVGKILVESLGAAARRLDDASLVRDLGRNPSTSRHQLQVPAGLRRRCPRRLIQAKLLSGAGSNPGPRPEGPLRGPGRGRGAERSRRLIGHARPYRDPARRGWARGDDHGARGAGEIGSRAGRESQLTGLSTEAWSPPLESLHSAVVVDEVLNRFTVRALVEYLAGRLGSLPPGDRHLSGYRPHAVRPDRRIVEVGRGAIGTLRMSAPPRTSSTTIFGFRSSRRAHHRGLRSERSALVALSHGFEQLGRLERVTWPLSGVR